VDSLGAFFATRQLRTQRDVVALAAATYAAVLGALTRGDEREARALLTVLNESMAQWDEEPIPSGKQYLLQCAALADLLERREKDLAQRLVALATHTVRERERALESDSTSVRREGKGSPVLSIPALVGLASLMNVSVSLAPLCQSAPHLGELASLIQSDWSLVE
jgi:hypothetical protein